MNCLLYPKNLIRPKTFLFLALLTLANHLFAQVGHSDVVNYKTIDWTVLMPEQWLRAIKKDFDALYKLPNLQDGSPQANKAMQEIQKKFDDAPIVKEQINKKVRISGYVVSLDASRDKYREFLLVPYFGACIHLPPPPANQIILIKSGTQTKFTKLPESMDMVWIEGELKESRVSTAQGISGYALTAVSVLPYEKK